MMQVKRILAAFLAASAILSMTGITVLASDQSGDDLNYQAESFLDSSLDGIPSVNGSGTEETDPLPNSVQKLIEQIDALPTVEELTSEEGWDGDREAVSADIAAALALYKSLSADEKALVPDEELEKLEALCKLDALVSGVTPLPAGDYAVVIERDGQVLDSGYDTLAAAIAAAQEGDTVVL
ncbi:MAG: hypothetical protein DBX44_01740, partial [Oscillospiraceae bacterium]